jgi:TetR/AcrR family transcriptional regulator, fatty acid biosynthesis regulator
LSEKRPITTSAPVAADLNRAQRKQRTRAALMQAALTLKAEGRGFDSLSLREITARAGVVPATIYRHFPTLDDLGLALVEESGVTLRRLLRDVRKTGLPPGSMLMASVNIYRQFIEDHRAHFMFYSTERSGGSPALRAAVRREEAHFCHELALDLRQLGTLSALSSSALQMTCALVVGTMMWAAAEMLDLPCGTPEPVREWELRFVRQLRLIFLGARAWREESQAAVDKHESQAARSAVDKHESQAARSAVDKHESRDEAK